jgi:phosphohistidine phosphatase
MKTLILIRHAKSSWDDPALADRERPLAGRGKRDVVMMGARLAARGVRPDLIMSSPAVRALATAHAIADALHHRACDIVVNARLYDCQADDWLGVVGALDDKFKRAILLGHNPEMTDFAHGLASEITHLPTCAVAEFAFDTKAWNDVAQTRPVLVSFDFPKKT